MSLHSELLTQARFLARKERKKPTQASLRRSVSASYYALFHLLVDEATRLMLSGKRGRLRDSLARAFHHSSMKQVAALYAEQKIPPKLSSVFNGETIPKELSNVLPGARRSIWQTWRTGRSRIGTTFGAACTPTRS